MPALGQGANATWTAGSNGAWDTGSNWSTGSAASGSTSTATFGAASGTSISINAPVAIGTLQFNSGASAYSIAVNSGGSLTLGANGIVNNSSNPLSLTVNANARVNFNGTSTAANSILFLNSQGVIDFSNSTGTLTAGSLGGSTSTNVYLGSRTLTVGSLNTNTTFQGIISDGGNSGLTGGSLKKVGTGTLILDRDNTYTGTTTISAGTLQIGNSGSTGSILGNVVNNSSLVFNRGGTSTFAGTISGTGTVTKSGGGTVTLSGTNSYSGGTFFNGGSLSAAADGNLGNSAGTLTFNGGTLLYGAAFSTGRGVTLTGAGTFNTSSFSPTLSGVISGAGTLTKSGAGTLTLTGANTYTGNTTVSAGTLQVGSGGTSGGINGNVSISNGATLAFNRSNSMTYAGVLSGSGSVSKLGTNTLTLSGNNTYSGTTTLNGALILTGAKSGGGATTVNAGASLQVGNGGTTGSLAGNVTNSGALVFNRSNDLTYAGLISGSGSLTKQGAGTLVLTGNQTFTGTTTIDAGTLQIGDGGTTGSLAGNIVDNGVLAFNRSDDFTIGGDISGTGSLVKMGAGTLTLTGTISYSGTTTILGGALFVGTGGTTGTLIGDLLINTALTFNRSDDYLYGGVISGTGSLTKMGAGTLTFTGENLYTGGTTISEGALQLGNGGATGSIVGDVVDNSSFIFNHSNDITFGGVISGTGTLTKRGAGTLTLAGANTYSGGTFFNAGMVAITADNNLGDAAGGLAFNGGALRFLANPTIARAITLGAAGGIFDTPTSAPTISGVISGSGSLTKAGDGYLFLTGANTYTGGTVVSAGRLIGNSTSLQGSIVNNAFLQFDQVAAGTYAGSISGTGELYKQGAPLTLTGVNTYTGETTLGGGTLEISSGGSINGTSAVTMATTSFAQATLRVTGSSSSIVSTGVFKAGHLGTGVLNIESGGSISDASAVIGSAATATGMATVSGAGSVWHNTGTLTIGDGGSGKLFVNNGSVVDASSIVLANLSGSSGTLYVGQGTGAGTINTATITGGAGTALVYFSHTESAYSLASQLTGSLGVVHSSSGKTILTGTNTYTGSTTVNAGVLEVSGSGTINGTSGISLAAIAPGNATLNINGTLASVRTTGAVNVGQLGTGTLNVTGGSVLTSANGTLGVAAGSTGTATVSGSGSLWSNTGALTIGANGTGVLSVSNGGVVSASTIRLGDLAGSSGTLNMGSGAAAGTLNTATITGGAGATSLVNFNHNASGYTLAAQLGGNLAVNQVGSGTTILTATNTYTGLTTISGGTLQIGNGGTTGSITGNILNNGILAFNRSDDFTFAGDIAGTGSLIKMGAGILTLTGSLTYTGTTTILAGQLLIGTGGNTGNWDADINTNSSVTFNRSDDLVYGHVVSGSGSVVKLGAGTLTFTGANTYTGGTTITAGTLQIGNGGTTGSLVGNIVDNSNLAFNRSDDVSFGGVISGTGTLTKLGAGTLTLNGANTYSGGTIINAGTLAITADNNLGAAAGGVTFNGGTLQLASGITTSRSVALNSGGTIDTGAGTATFSGTISGTGALTKVGSGTLVLSGANNYSGGTTVAAGQLYGSTQSIQGNVVDNGSVQFAQSGAGTYAGSISGTGSLIKQGAKLTITGNNTYAGATTVTGELEVIAGGKIEGTSSITLGQGAFQNGSMHVTGAGSKVTTAGDITVGSFGLGTLTVDSGAVVKASRVVLGAATGSSGQLYIGSGGAAGAVNASTIIDGAGTNCVVYLNHTDSSYTLAAQLANSLSVNVTGPGTTTLTGTNTYTGGTVLAAGTLKISKNENLGSNTGALTFDGGKLQLTANVNNMNRTLVLNPAGGTIDTGAFSLGVFGGISGAGGLTKIGAGTLTLNGASTYTGGTTVNLGTLRGTTDSLRGTIRLNEANNPGLATVTFVQQLDDTFGGTLMGFGNLTKEGVGNLTLSGANTFVGATNVNEGTLTVNGSLGSSVLVALGATLAGSGTVGGPVTVDGTLAPGAVPGATSGTLTINGALHFHSGSVLQVAVDDTGHNTRVNVGNSGAAVIDSGSVVDVRPSPSDSYAASSTYTLLNAQGGVSGTFDSVSSDFAFLDPTLSYDTNNVYLTLTRNEVPFTALATTSNEVAAASYLETLAHDTGAAKLMSHVNQLTKTEAGETFRSLAGETLTDASSVSMRDTESFTQLLAGRLISGNTGQGTGLAFSRLVSGTPPTTTSARQGLWAGSFNSGGGMKGDGNAAGYEWHGNGAALGLDAKIDEATLVGVSASYSHDLVEPTAGRALSSQIRSPRLMLYAQHDTDSLQLRGITGCANHAYTTRRRVTVGSSTSLLNGQHDATECSAYAEAELNASVSLPNLRPIVALNYSHLDERRYTETGGLAALAVEGRTTATFASNAGLRYSRQLDSERGMFEARAIWTHRYGDVEPALRASLAGAEERGTFTVRGTPRARDSAVFGAGFAGSISRNTLFHVDYNLEIGQGAQHAFVAGFRYVH